MAEGTHPSLIYFTYIVSFPVDLPSTSSSGILSLDFLPLSGMRKTINLERVLFHATS